VSVAARVRQAMQRARAAQPGVDRETRLQAIRAASRDAFPTTQLDDMLADIAAGYGDLP